MKKNDFIYKSICKLLFYTTMSVTQTPIDFTISHSLAAMYIKARYDQSIQFKYLILVNSNQRIHLCNKAKDVKKMYEKLEKHGIKNYIIYLCTEETHIPLSKYEFCTLLKWEQE